MKGEGISYLDDKDCNGILGIVFRRVGTLEDTALVGSAERAGRSCGGHGRRDDLRDGSGSIRRHVGASKSER